MHMYLWKIADVTDPFNEEVMYVGCKDTYPEEAVKHIQHRLRFDKGNVRFTVEFLGQNFITDALGNEIVEIIKKDK